MFSLPGCRRSLGEQSKFSHPYRLFAQSAPRFRFFPLLLSLLKLLPACHAEVPLQQNLQQLVNVLLAPPPPARSEMRNRSRSPALKRSHSSTRSWDGVRLLGLGLKLLPVPEVQRFLRRRHRGRVVIVINMQEKHAPDDETSEHVSFIPVFFI